MTLWSLNKKTKVILVLKIKNIEYTREKVLFKKNKIIPDRDHIF